VEHNKKLHVSYVDYEKAVDRVNWTKMMEKLQNIGVEWKDRRQIKNLYSQQSAFVKSRGREVRCLCNWQRSKTRMYTIAIALQSI